MKIEIDYDGNLAACRIEPIDEPGKMVDFNDADDKSQAYAISAFLTVKIQWNDEQRLALFKNHPVIHVKREIEINTQNFNQLQELVKEGVICKWSYDMLRTPAFSVELSDSHTVVEDNDWLIQGTEGRWGGIKSDYHRMLEEYQKIVVEQ